MHRFMPMTVFTRVTLLTLLCLSVAGPMAQAQAQVVAERYSPTPASADGIGKRYMGREIAGVMGWQGAAWLEREERERQSALICWCGRCN